MLLVGARPVDISIFSFVFVKCMGLRICAFRKICFEGGRGNSYMGESHHLKTVETYVQNDMSAFRTLLAVLR